MAGTTSRAVVPIATGEVQYSLGDGAVRCPKVFVDYNVGVAGPAAGPVSGHGVLEFAVTY